MDQVIGLFCKQYIYLNKSKFHRGKNSTDNIASLNKGERE
jgi:hypothetical protein